MSYFFFLYQLPSLSFSTVSDSISSNIDEVLSINPSTNVFVFGEDFNIHHKDWLTYSGGTDQSWKIYYNFSNDLTLMVNFPARDWFSQSCSFGFIFSDASICSTMTFPPLGNSDHVVVSVSIDFPLNSQQNVPFHHITDEYSQADWDSLHDHLGNVKLIFCFA